MIRGPIIPGPSLRTQARSLRPSLPAKTAMSVPPTGYNRIPEHIGNTGKGEHASVTRETNETAMTTVVIVPTYNEAENIRVLAELILEYLPQAHVMVMDDNSPDRTADIAERLFASRPEMHDFRVVRRTGPRGLGRAYRDGFQRALLAGYDRIIQMDADLSHDPAHLPELLEASLAFDLVIGSRYCPGGGVRNWPWFRLWLSRFAVRYVQKVARLPIDDATAGYRCWSRHALKSVQIDTLDSEGYSFQVEMGHRAHRVGMRIKEIPILFTDRRFGRSKISRSVMMESFKMPWRLRFKPWSPSEAAVQPLSVAKASAPGASGKTGV